MKICFKNFNRKWIITIALMLVGVALYYFVSNDSRCIRLPLRTLSCSNCFYVDGKVNGNACFLELCLGSNFEFSLSQKLMESIHKKKLGVLELTDENGRETNDPLYQVPEISIGDWKIKNAVAREKIYDFSLDFPASKSNRSYRIGALGVKILQRTNVLLDIPHSCLYLTKSLSKLKKIGYKIVNWVEVPFQMPNGLMKIQVKTDLGVKNFIISSSTTHVVLKSSQAKTENGCLEEIFQSKVFMINQEDFGVQELLAYDLPDEFPADGLIGLSFLKNHAIYIDYPNKRLYIQK